MIKNFTKRMFASRMSGNSVVIVGAKRTPIGSFMGSLKHIPATQLGSGAAAGAIIHAGIEPSDIEEVYFG